MDRSQRLLAWRRDGWFVIPGFADAARVYALAQACDHALASARARDASAGRTSTHLPSLLDPQAFAERPELLARLVAFASAPDVLALISDLGARHEGALNLRDAQYFHEPTQRDYDGEWHRDGDIVTLPKLVASPRCTVPTVPTVPTLLRLRIAFAPDDHLEVIPGSQRRDDTPEEARLRRGPIRNGSNAPGAVRVTLEPGDVCVFDTWAIHRGRYRHGAARRTLDLQYGFGPRRSRVYEAVRAFAARKLG
jgi:ectoine hydroxylase-related dioxygenase (phytanoyl-CoA dioxygenase family)